nr:hypothetical protein Iba_chr03eCG11070 [Ipomoea batatas]
MSEETKRVGEETHKSWEEGHVEVCACNQEVHESILHPITTYFPIPNVANTEYGHLISVFMRRATCRGIRISEYRIDDVSSEHRGIRAERTFGFGLAYYVLTTFADFAVNGCEVTCKKKKSNRFK